MGCPSFIKRKSQSGFNFNVLVIISCACGVRGILRNRRPF
jgi:hypothetical protein